MLWETHVDHPGGVALLEVEQHGRLMEEGEHRHVFNLIVLGRVLRMDVNLFDSNGLTGYRTQLQNTVTEHSYRTQIQNS